MGNRTRWLAAGTVWLLLGAPSSAQETPHGAIVPMNGTAAPSLAEVARQVNNPIGPLLQVTFDNEILGLRGGGLAGVEPSYAGSLEPHGPIPLDRIGLGRFEWAENFQIAAQMIVPFVETVPGPRGLGGVARKSGFGDIQLGAVIAPNRRSGFLWGIGPTFVLPSASDDALGQGKWQAGPAAVAGYMGEKWTAYLLAQQWWSFAGSRARADTNQLCLNYVLLRNLPGRWVVGMQPTMSVDWTASSDDAVQFPVGLGVGKTVRIGSLAIQFWLEADYYAVRPAAATGPRWGVDLQITPVFSVP